MGDWYENKELFEMMEGFKDEMNNLRLEMKQTTTLIRDYNDLRKTMNHNTRKIHELEKVVQAGMASRREYIGYIIAAISTLFLLLNYIK